MFNDCNVYTLYKNKIVITPKDLFIKKCLPFDPMQYYLEFQQFEATVDSIGLKKDSIPSVVLSKLNYLKARYSSVNHIDIKHSLAQLNTSAFFSVNYAFPSGYINCYKDESMPIEERKSCIQALFDQYGRSSNFSKVIYLEKEFIKYFGKADIQNNWYMTSSLDSVKCYLAKIDSLQKTTLPDDSLYYFKALALKTICGTRWHCSEGCGGCDYSPVTKKLKTFAAKYPESRLLDDAAFDYIQINYMYNDGEDDALIAQNAAYESFLKKYPDTELLADAQYAIFINWSSMQTLDNKKIKSTGQRFIKNFGSDKRAASIKRQLDLLMNR